MAVAKRKIRAWINLANTVVDAWHITALITEVPQPANVTLASLKRSAQQRVASSGIDTFSVVAQFPFSESVTAFPGLNCRQRAVPIAGNFLDKWHAPFSKVN